METTTPTTSAKVETSSLAKPLSAAAVESTQATSRFPTRARHPGSEGQADVETTSEEFFSSQDWTESARNLVREHPLAVVGVALVAGLIVGRL